MEWKLYNIIRLNKQMVFFLQFFFLLPIPPNFPSSPPLSLLVQKVKTCEKNSLPPSSGNSMPKNPTCYFFYPFLFFITPACLSETRNRHFSSTNHEVPVSIFKFTSSLLHFIFFLFFERKKSELILYRLEQIGGPSRALLSCLPFDMLKLKYGHCFVSRPAND